MLNLRAGGERKRKQADGIFKQSNPTMAQETSGLWSGSARGREGPLLQVLGVSS